MNQAQQTVTNIFTSLQDEDTDTSDPNYFYFKLKPDMEYLFSPGQRVDIFKKVAGELVSANAGWLLNAAGVGRDSSGDVVGSPAMQNWYIWPEGTMADLKPTWYSGDGAAFYPSASDTSVSYPTNNDIANWALSLTPLGRLKEYWARIQLPIWKTATSILSGYSAVTAPQTNLAFIAHMFARPS